MWSRILCGGVVGFSFTALHYGTLQCEGTTPPRDTEYPTRRFQATCEFLSAHLRRSGWTKTAGGISEDGGEPETELFSTDATFDGILFHKALSRLPGSISIPLLTSLLCNVDERRTWDRNYVAFQTVEVLPLADETKGGKIEINGRYEGLAAVVRKDFKPVDRRVMCHVVHPTLTRYLGVRPRVFIYERVVAKHPSGAVELLFGSLDAKGVTAITADTVTFAGYPKEKLLPHTVQVADVATMNAQEFLIIPCAAVPLGDLRSCGIADDMNVTTPQPQQEAKGVWLVGSSCNDVGRLPVPRFIASRIAHNVTAAANGWLYSALLERQQKF